MRAYTVEMVLPGTQNARIALAAGTELDEQPALRRRLSPTVEESLGRLQIFPTMDGSLIVETNPRSNRSIRITPECIEFIPPGSEREWSSLFHLQRTRPPSIVFADGTSIVFSPRVE